MPKEKNMSSSIKMPMNACCDFCKPTTLSEVYAVPDSPLAMKVAVCDSCGLVQSLQTSFEEKERIVSPSSDARWGNIRHAKGLRFKAARAILEQRLPWNDINSILDVGSNRGDFVKWMKGKNASSSIAAVEPDGKVVEEYDSLPYVKLYLQKLEDSDWSPDSFDLIYCSHTLEHAASASTMLRQMAACLKIDGYLFLEVPNIDVLKAQDAVEEFFIDKHRFHFNRSILRCYLETLGFGVLYENPADDIFNVTFLVQKKNSSASDFVKVDAAQAAYNKELIVAYANRLRENREILTRVVANLQPFMERQKVAFWGAGRIFDALVRYGGLKPEKLCCLVDEYLSGLISSSHQVAIKDANFLRAAQPDVIVILARSSTNEIAAKARRFGFKKIIQFADLLSQAKRSA
jgi:SAM-dependent methyltransferase